jgi:hypothetical protein
MRTFLAVAAIVWTAPLFGQTPLPIHSKTLENGLEVIVIENRSVPLVTIELDVKNGAYTETPEYDGLSHLYEHMFFKANRTIPNQEAYLERLNELGAAWNGTTSGERVNYFITVGVDSLLPALQFMEDAIRHPLFLEEELVRERPVVLGEYDRAESDPFFHFGRAIDTLLWSPEYWSRKNLIGDREVLSTTPPEKMRTIQERFYVPNNTALILSGDIGRRRPVCRADPRPATAGRDPGDRRRATGQHGHYPDRLAGAKRDWGSRLDIRSGPPDPDPLQPGQPVSEGAGRYRLGVQRGVRLLDHGARGADFDYRPNHGRESARAAPGHSDRGREDG